MFLQDCFYFLRAIVLCVFCPLTVRVCVWQPVVERVAGAAAAGRGGHAAVPVSLPVVLPRAPRADAAAPRAKRAAFT